MDQISGFWVVSALMLLGIVIFGAVRLFRWADTADFPCRLCGGTVKAKTIESGNCLGVAIGLLLIGVGVVLCFTGIGAIVGVPMILVGLFMGGKRRKVWRCQDCGTIVGERT